jgi:hypothetical protein
MTLVAPNDTPIVGWGTTSDGQHVPIHKDFAEALWQAADDEKAKREADMPTERDAIYALNQAIHRLKELGWKDPVYAPKDGSHLDLIEPGSTGIHQGAYTGKWPNGSWWIYDDGCWPSRPVLACASRKEEQL